MAHYTVGEQMEGCGEMEPQVVLVGHQPKLAPELIGLKLTVLVDITFLGLLAVEDYLDGATIIQVDYRMQVEQLSHLGGVHHLCRLAQMPTGLGSIVCITVV